MKVLVGCEESQVVCKAFISKGHEAYSCDIEPTRGNPEWHIQGDIVEHLESVPYGWYDLIILHPDCTAMSLSGNRWYGKGMPYHQQRIDAVEWTTDLWELAKTKANSVALENPKSVIFPVLRSLGAVVQFIQPYQFGHPETKETGLALHNLPELTETDNCYDYMMTLPKKERHKIWYASPGPDRKRDRSVTYQGIADAMADQWGL